MHCSSADGVFCMLAIDHRDNLLALLNRHAAQPLTDGQFAAFKQQVIGALAESVTAVLVDPVYGFGRVVADRTISGQIGLLAPLEVTDYDLHPSKRTVQFIAGWSVTSIKRYGGDGVKLLLPYHPEAVNVAEKDAMVRRIVAECDQHEIPFFLEPIAYSLEPDQPLSDGELRDVVVAMARHFSAMGVDVLKMQFPAGKDQSEAVWRAGGGGPGGAGGVPRAPLGAGVDYATFAQQARVACECGASGVIVGRAVWAEAVAAQGAERSRFLHEEAPVRMAELMHICQEYARPWFDRVQSPQVTLNWYSE